MKTPRDKYLNDPEYHHLVCLLEDLIRQARFTPSELREACILASINYEMQHLHVHHINPSVDDALRILEEHVNSKPGKR
jgi:hypothetical protein